MVAANEDTKAAKVVGTNANATENAEMTENAAELLYEAARVHDTAAEEATNRGEKVLRVHTD